MMFTVPNIPRAFVEEWFRHEDGLGVDDIDKATQLLRFAVAITGRDRLADVPEAVKLVQEIAEWGAQQRSGSADTLAREWAVRAVLKAVQTLEQAVTRKQE